MVSAEVLGHAAGHGRIIRVRMQVVATAEQDGPKNARAGRRLHTTIKDIVRHVARTGRVGKEIDAVGIAAIGLGVLLHPFDDIAHVLAAGRPMGVRCQPIVGIDG